MKKLLLLLLMIWGVQSCIPLSDLFPPTIDLTAEDGSQPFVETLYYQDSIILNVSYRDNAALKLWRVNIDKMQAGNLDADWQVSEQGVFERPTRGYESSIRLAIPARLNDNYLATGDYRLSVIVMDLDSNFASFADTFTIDNDKQLPQFLDLSVLLNRPIPADAPTGTEYYTCPNQPVKFSGWATDNTKLRRIGYSYTGAGDVSYPVRNNVFEYDTVVADGYLNDSLSVIFPESLNGQLITLSLFAEDVFLNRHDTTFNVYLNCDATAPVITFSGLSKPEVQGVISVVEGTDFTINNLHISDNQALRNVEVYFHDLSTSPQLFDEYVFNGTKNDTLITAFTIPSNLLDLNVSYKLTLTAHDTSTILLPEGNTTNRSFELQVVEDLAPAISNMDITFHKGTAAADITFNTVLPGTTLSAGGILGGDNISYLSIDGKGDDDVGIVQLTLKWRTPSGVVSNVVNRSFNPAEEVLKFNNFYEEGSVFLLTQVGTYSLEVIMTDTKGQKNGATAPESRRTYYFVVEN